jgi:flagellar hook-length control protein FliK
MLLEPSNLGSVWLRLVSAPKGLVASFRVSTQSALAAFRQGMGGLAQDLQRAGVAVDHLAVGLSLSWSGCQERQEPTSGGQARLETRGRVERQESAHGSPAVPAIQRGPGTSGLLDTIA